MIPVGRSAAPNEWAGLATPRGRNIKGDVKVDQLGGSTALVESMAERPGVDHKPKSAGQKSAGQRVSGHLLLLFTKIVPVAHWYRTALWLVAAQAHIQGIPAPQKLDKIDLWMRRLAQFHTPFPIPWTVVGTDVLPPPGPVKNGVLYCSSHIPMVRMGLRALIELGHPPTAAIADPAVFVANSQMIPVWGSTEQVPAIAAGRHALARTRSVLRKGGSVVLLTDTEPSGGHSPNFFHLSRRLGTRMIFFFTEVRKDGSILVSFKKPPHPVCTTEESIRINIAWLEGELRGIAARFSK